MASDAWAVVAAEVKVVDLGVAVAGCEVVNTVKVAGAVWAEKATEVMEVMEVAPMGWVVHVAVPVALAATAAPRSPAPDPDSEHCLLRSGSCAPLT